MVDIVVREDWYQIDEELFFSVNSYQKDKINLAFEKWEDVTFWKNEFFLINYPWEYDKDDIFFKVYSSKEWNLNYIIKKDWKKIVLISSEDILEDQEIEWVDYWIYLDENVAKKLNEMELEWEKISLKEIWKDKNEDETENEDEFLQE